MFLDPTVVETSPVNATVLEGGNVVLFCNASGNPNPAINWTKDGSNQVLHEGETYTIANVSRQADGSYTCSAGNGIGEKQRRIAVVTVHCKYIIV